MINNKKRHLIYVFIILLFLWTLILPFRSIIYVKRIINEFRSPIKKYNIDIDPCNKDIKVNTLEAERLYEYKSLGLECEK